MQKEYGLVVCTYTWLTIAKNPHAIPFQLIARGVDIVDLIANMVHAAPWIFLQEFLDR